MLQFETELQVIERIIHVTSVLLNSLNSFELTISSEKCRSFLKNPKESILERDRHIETKHGQLE